MTRGDAHTEALLRGTLADLRDLVESGRLHAADWDQQFAALLDLHHAACRLVRCAQRHAALLGTALEGSRHGGETSLP